MTEPVIHTTSIPWEHIRKLETKEQENRALATEQQNMGNISMANYYANLANSYMWEANALRG
jgi:hypothetical protein